MSTATAACSLAATRSQPVTMPAGTIKRIHVNQQMIRSNKKHGTKENVITIQWRNKSYRVKHARIKGGSTAVYSPDKPLSCGARVWIETTSEVIPVYE
jgi:hypothetical protein